MFSGIFAALLLLVSVGSSGSSSLSAYEVTQLHLEIDNCDTMAQTTVLSPSQATQCSRSYRTLTNYLGGYTNFVEARARYKENI